MGSPLLGQTAGKVHSRERIFHLPDIVVDVCSDVNLIPEKVASKLGLVNNHTNDFDFRTPTGERVSIRYYTNFLLTIAGVTMKVKAYIIPKVVMTTFPLLLGLNWLKEVHDDLQHYRLRCRFGGYETLIKGMRKSKPVKKKKKIVVMEVGFLEIEEPTLVQPDIEAELVAEYPALMEPEIEEELVIEDLALVKPDIQAELEIEEPALVEPEIEKPALEETKIEEEPAVKEVIQEDKLPELLVEDLTTEEHGTEDTIELLSQSKIEEPTLEIDNRDPQGDNLTIDHAIEDFVIQYSVVEDSAAKDLPIEGEAFQKVVMDITVRGSDGCLQADISTRLMQRRALAIGGYSTHTVQERRGIG